ncbi:hypothetical protein RRG08_016455 [Elysia crispata]|uniref:Uncharacterized protein n=1 Tax=Elysia crispata TaxID=231223 RepID=A0AAE1CUQ2_9GAST|nr:hypothetical protein RRG08_016455 [Elysia crispata]
MVETRVRGRPPCTCGDQLLGVNCPAEGGLNVKHIGIVRLSGVVIPNLSRLWVVEECSACDRGMHGELAGQMETPGEWEGYFVACTESWQDKWRPGGKHRWMTSTGGQQTLGIPADTITSQVSGPLRFLDDHQLATAAAAAAADKHSHEPSLDRAVWETDLRLDSFGFYEVFQVNRTVPVQSGYSAIRAMSGDLGLSVIAGLLWCTLFPLLFIFTRLS